MVIYIIFILLLVITDKYMTQTNYSPEDMSILVTSAFFRLNHQLNQYEKSEEIFFKSQVSLAETCQDEHQRNASFAVDNSDEEILSTDSNNNYQFSPEIQICQHFFLKGCCMRGKNCEYAHIPLSFASPKDKARRIKRWIREEMPEMLTIKERRVNSFLF